MLLLFFLLLSGREVSACTGDYYTLPAGASQDIDECGTCKLVTNNGATQILVPTKTNAEWTAFYTNVDASTGGNVTIGTCGTTCTYPLDTVATPSAAYSLRKIKSAYAGALIRIRRSSECVPRLPPATAYNPGDSCSYFRTLDRKLGRRIWRKSPHLVQPQLNNPLAHSLIANQDSILFCNLVRPATTLGKGIAYDPA